MKVCLISYIFNLESTMSSYYSHVSLSVYIEREELLELRYIFMYIHTQREKERYKCTSSTMCSKPNALLPQSTLGSQQLPGIEKTCLFLRILFPAF